MKRILTTLAAAVIALPAMAHNVVPGEAQSEPVLLQGGTLHTVANGTHSQTDLLIVDGKIAAIGTDLELPENTRTVDISGQRVYPGIMALDTTLGMVELSAVRATVDTNEVGNVTPEVVAHRAYNADSEIIPTIRYNGVTHAQIVPQGNLVRGNSSLIKLDSWNWQDGLEAGEVGIHLSWPRAGLNTAWWERRSPAEQRKAAAEQREALNEVFVKAQAYHEGRVAGTQRRTDQRWESMRGLFTGEKKLFVHAHDRRQFSQIQSFNERYGFELVIVGGRDAWMVADELAAADIPVILDAAFGLPTRADEAYDSQYAAPAVLAEAGVTFAMAYPGFWDTRNLAFAAGNAVAFGLNYDDAVAAITYAPAKIMGVEDRLGTLEVGKQASLIVSEGDVLDLLGQTIRYMFIDGREVDLSNKQRQLFDKYMHRAER